MKTHLLTIVTTSLSICAAFAEPGNELLEKVKSKYETCSSFFCEGTTKTISNMFGKDKPHKMESKFSIRFQRPNLLRVDWFKPSQASFTPQSASLYTKDGKYFGVPGHSPTPEEFKSIEIGMGTYAGISGGVTYMIPSILIGKNSYLSDFTSQLGSDVMFDDRDCYTLELKDKKTGDWIILIDKETLAILRTKQVQVVKAEESRKQMEGAMQALRDKNIPLPNLPKEDYTIETTIDYSSVTFDKAMQANEFEYKENKS